MKKDKSPLPEREFYGEPEAPIILEKHRRTLKALFFWYLMLILLMSCTVVGSLFSFLWYMDFIPPFMIARLATPLLLLGVVVLISMALSTQVGSRNFKAVDDLIDAMGKVSKGDFSTRIPVPINAPDSIANVARSFNAMAADLGGIEMFRKDFINNFSHEFKTPIVSIRGFAKQLERDDLTEAQRKEYLDIIVSESERLANMSSNVLLLTKLENQRILADRVPYSLDEQLRNCILLLEKYWEAKSIDLNLALDEVSYNGNEETMSHVWINLIGNAIKFSHDGGTLDISCHNTDSGVIVSVRDHGEGMDEQTQQRVFEKFYQGDTSHATEGNGLGLSLVKRIVELCYGTIDVVSAVDEGTCFTIELPNLPIDN